jgi:NADPH:quinone reductase-like Zn-dependent oxidoreductase
VGKSSPSTSRSGGRVFGPLGRYLRALLLSPFVSQRLRVHAAKPSADDLDALADLLGSGAVTPAIEATYPLAGTPEAIRRFRDDHARAKLVITV